MLPSRDAANGSSQLFSGHECSKQSSFDTNADKCAASKATCCCCLLACGNRNQLQLAHSHCHCVVSDEVGCEGLQRACCEGAGHGARASKGHGLRDGGSAGSAAGHSTLSATTQCALTRRTRAPAQQVHHSAAAQLHALLGSQDISSRTKAVCRTNCFCAEASTAMRNARDPQQLLLPSLGPTLNSTWPVSAIMPAPTPRMRDRTRGSRKGEASAGGAAAATTADAAEEVDGCCCGAAGCCTWEQQ
jgi:hypothetical protein